MTLRLFLLLVLTALPLACRSIIERSVGEPLDCFVLPTKYSPGYELNTNANFVGAWLQEMNQPRIRSTWLSGRRKFRLTILPHNFAPLAISVTERGARKILQVQHAPGAGGWCPEDGDTSFYETTHADHEIELGVADWDRLLKLIDSLDFWSRPIADDFPTDTIAFHYTSSVLEGAERYRYHYISRGMGSLEADEPQLAEICRLLVRVAEVEPAAPYETCGLTPAA